MIEEREGEDMPEDSSNQIPQQETKSSQMEHFRKRLNSIEESLDRYGDDEEKAAQEFTKDLAELLREARQREDQKRMQNERKGLRETLDGLEESLDPYRTEEEKVQSQALRENISKLREQAAAQEANGLSVVLKELEQWDEHNGVEKARFKQTLEGLREEGVDPANLALWQFIELSRDENGHVLARAETPLGEAIVFATCAPDYIIERIEGAIQEVLENNGNPRRSTHHF